MSDTKTTLKNRFGLKSVLCLGVGLSAIGMSMPAMAQDAAEETATTEATAESPRRMNQVTVSATRREGATVQDVPIAVTALDAALLDEAGFTRINDLEQLAPSIQITQGQSSAAGTSISIRGLGTGGDNPGFEPAVGVFIDGVYRTKTGIALGDLPELDSVEVLRGPQGTLFGRNTSAGALSVKTAGPERDPRLTVTASAGNFNAISGELTATTPLTETWAGRIDLKFRDREGYIDDVNSDRSFNDIERFIARVQLARETANSDFRFIADYGQTDEQCCTAVNLIAGNPANPTTPGGIGVGINTVAGLQGLVGIAAPGNPEAYLVAASPNRDLQEDVEEYGFSGEYNYRGDFGRFTSLTAFRNWQVDRNQDIDFSGVDRAYRDGYFIEDQMFTQEFRLQGNWENVDWLVGAFFLDESLELVDTVRIGTNGNFYLDAVTSGATANALIPTGFQLTGSLPGVPSLFVNVPPGAIPGVQGPVVRFGFDPTNPANSIAISQNFAPFFTPGNNPGEGQVADRWGVDTQALAIFTHNEIAFGDRTTLTVGLRYNMEEKDLTANLNSQVSFCSFIFTPAGQSVVSQLNAIGAGALAVLGCNPTVNSEFNGTYQDSISENELTGTLSLGFDVTEDLLIYGGYSRGYKSGGWNLDRSSFQSALFAPGSGGADTSQLQFDAEIVDAFELGWKWQIPSAGATINGAVFYQDIDGYQFNTFVGTSFVTYNTAAEAKGLELDFGWEPVENLVLGGGFSYTDITYAENPPQFPFPLEGRQISNSPEFVWTGQATYTFPLFSGVEGVVHGNLRWQSETDTNIAVYNPASGVTSGGPLTNDAYALINGRFTIKAEDDKWELSIFGENLTDEYYNINTFPVPEQTGVYTGYPALPRFWGVEAKVTF